MKGMVRGGWLYGRVRCTMIRCDGAGSPHFHTKMSKTGLLCWYGILSVRYPDYFSCMASTRTGKLQQKA